MHAIKCEAVVKADHRLSIELPEAFPVGEVEVTVRAKRARHPDTPTHESLVEFLDWLKTQPPTGRSKEEIDAQIAEERDSWGSD